MRPWPDRTDFLGFPPGTGRFGSNPKLYYMSSVHIVKKKKKSAESSSDNCPYVTAGIFWIYFYFGTGVKGACMCVGEVAWAVHGHIRSWLVYPPTP